MALESNAEKNVITELASRIRLPGMMRVRQNLDRSCYKKEEIVSVVRDELQRVQINECLKPGMQIAVTCGSRGVANIAVITKAIVDFVKQCGADPFIFPAMGSHGGATAEGQMQILAGYGVTEKSMGCPIKATMDVEEIGRTEVIQTSRGTKKEIPVYLDKYACRADGIILCNRVKPHTAFQGDYESGILKMAVIGMGKQKGAELIHQDGFRDLGVNLPRLARTVFDHSRILGAIGTVENAFDETCKIQAMQKEDIWTQEPALLRYAKTRMGKLYLNPIDVLVVDQLGKDISGDGMDPNVTGRWAVPYLSGPIDVQRICVLSLTEATHGNCNGLGLADITTKRCVDQVDVDCTYPNVYTSTVVGTPKIPMFGHSDKTAIAMAIRTCNNIDHDRPRIVRIRDTMHLEFIEVSEALFKEADEHPDIDILEGPAEWKFDQNGNLFSDHTNFS